MNVRQVSVDILSASCLQPSRIEIYRKQDSKFTYLVFTWPVLQRFEDFLSTGNINEVTRSKMTPVNISSGTNLGVDMSVNCLVERNCRSANVVFRASRPPLNWIQSRPARAPFRSSTNIAHWMKRRRPGDFCACCFDWTPSYGGCPITFGCKLSKTRALNWGLR
jgi:hypothetical protein